MENNETDVKIEEREVVTDYGVVPEEMQDSLPKTVRYCTPRAEQSTLKKFMLWFMGIVGCITFLIVCVCLVFASTLLARDYRFAAVNGQNSIKDDDFLYYFDHFLSDSDTSESDFVINKSSNAGLGIVVVTLDSAKAETYGIKGGLVISGFTEVNSFSDTDIKVYDIITAAEGQTVVDSLDLTKLLNQHEPGDEMTLTITRFTDGYPDSFDITVTLIDKTLG